MYTSTQNQLATEPTSTTTDDPKLSPLIQQYTEEVGRESDDYEPPESTPPADEQVAIESPPFSPAPPEITSEQLENELSDVNEIQASNEISEYGIEEILPIANDSISRVAQVTKHHNQPHLCKKFLTTVQPVEQPAQIEHFTPYESPLKQFRNFRFHPEFDHIIPGGLRSNTYSHKINPGLEFCRYELAGGFCNDATCEFQHFRDIGLPGALVI
jgi:hypothetical protein